MKVDVYPTAGALLHSYASGTNPANLQLEQITAGPDGNIWFDTFFSGDNVVKMITGTGATTAFVYSPTIQNVMRGMAKGPDGNVWATAADSNLIARITPAGVLTTFAIPSANAQPYGITTGPDGNLYFTEPGVNRTTNKIGRITPAGTITEFSIPTALLPPRFHRRRTGQHDLVYGGQFQQDRSRWIDKSPEMLGRGGLAGLVPGTPVLGAERPAMAENFFEKAGAFAGDAGDPHGCGYRDQPRHRRRGQAHPRRRDDRRNAQDGRRPPSEQRDQREGRRAARPP